MAEIYHNRPEQNKVNNSKLTKCKHCGNTIAISAKTCPHCGGSNKPPFYERPGFIIPVGMLVLIFLIGILGGRSNPSVSSPTENNNSEILSSEPEEQATKEQTFTPIKVYEDPRVIISFSGVDSRGVNFEVENLTDKTITVQADSISINGYSTNDIIMSDDVAPKSIGKVNAKCSIDYTNPVGSLSGQLRIIDFEQGFEPYKVVLDNFVIDDSVNVDPKPNGTLVYSDDKVEIYYKEASDKSIIFDVKNLTGVNITVQADTISINKHSTNDIIMSSDIAPHSIGSANAKCSIEYDGEPSTISGKLRVHDMDNSFEHINAEFIDVTIQ